MRRSQLVQYIHIVVFILRKNSCSKVRLVMFCFYNSNVYNNMCCMHIFERYLKVLRAVPFKSVGEGRGGGKAIQNWVRPARKIRHPPPPPKFKIRGGGGGGGE